MTTPHYRLNAHDQRRLAVAAFCDIKTIRRYLTEPGSLRSTTRLRIEQAVAELGLAHLLGGTEGAPGAAP